MTKICLAPTRVEENSQTIKEIKKKKHYRKSPSILKLCWQFKDTDEFKKYIIEKESIPDCVAIEDVPFTMEEYDSDGKQIVYANLKLGLTLELNHENRYQVMSSITSIDIYEAGYFRNDISYLE